MDCLLEVFLISFKQGTADSVHTVITARTFCAWTTYVTGENTFVCPCTGTNGSKTLVLSRALAEHACSTMSYTCICVHSLYKRTANLRHIHLSLVSVSLAVLRGKLQICVIFNSHLCPCLLLSCEKTENKITLITIIWLKQESKYRYGEAYMTSMF